MGRPPKTKRERLDKREKMILDAAEKAILKKGPEGFTMAELARQVDLAEGTLYLYFRNKKSIIHAVVGRYWERSIVAAEEEVKLAEGCYEKMRALAKFHINLIRINEPLIGLTVYDRKPGSLESISDLELKRAYTAVFNQIFQLGVDTKVIGKDIELWMVRDLFFGTLTYMARTIIIHPDFGNKIDSAVDLLMDLVILSCQNRRPRANKEPENQLTVLIERIEALVSDFKITN